MDEMDEPQDGVPGSDREAEPLPTAAASFPRITWLITVLCIVVFLGLACESNPDRASVLTRWGLVWSDKIWEGEYWGLLTCTVVHEALWHLAFNVYWLWVLGTRIEGTLGSIRYLLLILGAAIVSSGCQLAVSDTTGIGASGVGYALFGFMWMAKDRIPRSAEALTPQVVRLFLVWLVGCMVVTRLGIWNVGNAAHVGGMLFGMATAGCFVWKQRRPLLLTALAGLVAASIVPLFWCPWSAIWLRVQAIHAQKESRHVDAVDYYSRLIDLEPNAAWAYYNRGVSQWHRDNMVQARTDFARAVKLDPKLKIPEGL